MEAVALNLIQQYMDGWKENNLPLIIHCLTKNCVVIESHGPTYHGVEAIEKWFKFWLAGKSKITFWSLNAFYFCEQKFTAFVEWDFSCVSNNKEYSFPGCSIYKFIGQEIDYIQEYRMTRSSYPWQGDKLIST